MAFSPSTYCTCTPVTLHRSMTGVEVGNQRWRRTGLWRRKWTSLHLQLLLCIGVRPWWRLGTRGGGGQAYGGGSGLFSIYICYSVSKYDRGGGWEPEVEADRLMEEKVAFSPSTTVALYRSTTGVEVGNQRWRRRGLWRRKWPSLHLLYMYTCYSA